MTLRDEFEKLCPVPDRAKWDEESGTYLGGDQYRMAAYWFKYQGFLLGRQNTVSVDKYKYEVELAHMAGQVEAEIDPSYSNAQLYYDSLAKRRTEEV